MNVFIFFLLILYQSESSYKKKTVRSPFLVNEAQDDGQLDKIDKTPAQALEKPLQPPNVEIEPTKSSAPGVEDPSKTLEFVPYRSSTPKITSPDSPPEVGEDEDATLREIEHPLEDVVLDKPDSDEELGAVGGPQLELPKITNVPEGDSGVGNCNGFESMVGEFFLYIYFL